MLKRLLGAALRARKYWSQCREILLRSLTLNIMILWWTKVFYRACREPFFYKNSLRGQPRGHGTNNIEILLCSL
ncbi:MAG: hypothetical protein JW959_01795 [Pirellulales bacterium]|nr:hypothetical protein [Pirellulales bacterium]